MRTQLARSAVVCGRLSATGRLTLPTRPHGPPPLHGSTIPGGPITATGSSLYLSLATDSSVTGTGFTAQLACPPPPNPCEGGVALVDEGSLDGSHGNSDLCTWSLSCSSGTTPVLTFSTFDLEAGYDTLSIYDGPSGTSPIIGQALHDMQPF